ncbi:MAG: 3-oxoacyl-ACP synthase III family protein [Candidatus Levyibacteriota bacterium]
MSKIERERIPAITGVGAAFGKNEISNERVSQLLGIREKTIGRMMSMTGAGIEHRRWVDSSQLGVTQTLTNPNDPKDPNYWKEHGLEVAASDLASEALLRASEMAGIDVKNIKAIVGASGSQDLRGVPIAAMIQDKLGLPRSTRAHDVYSACPGWLQALRNTYDSLLSPLTEGGPQAAIGSEVLSPILSKERSSLFVLFGDAAGATVVDNVIPDEGAPKVMAFEFGSDGSLAQELCMPGGGSKYPSSQETLDADLHTLLMNGPVVAEHAVNYMAEATQAALKKAGISREDVDWIIPHQANRGIMDDTYKRIMGDTADAAGIPYGNMIATVHKYGNTSASTIPIAMAEAIQEGKLKRNQLVVVTSFGAGFVYGAAVLSMVGLPKKA